MDSLSFVVFVRGVRSRVHRKIFSNNGIINLQPPSIRTNSCLPEGVQFEPRFQCLVHFVLCLVFHVHFLRDLVSKVGRFFHSVQFLSVWKFDHVVAIHRDITWVARVWLKTGGGGREGGWGSNPRVDWRSPGSTLERLWSARRQATPFCCGMQASLEPRSGAVDRMNYVNMSCTTCKLSCMHCVDTSPKMVYKQTQIFFVSKHAVDFLYKKRSAAQLVLCCET